MHENKHRDHFIFRVKAIKNTRDYGSEARVCEWLPGRARMSVEELSAERALIRRRHSAFSPFSFNSRPARNETCDPIERAQRHSERIKLIFNIS